jgi:hypothetical protein
MRHVTEEPCTRNGTGRGGSPVIGAQSHFRYMYRGASPFFAQYSALQIMLPPTGCAPIGRPETKSGADAQSGAFENGATWQGGIGFAHRHLPNDGGHNRLAGGLIKDNLAVCWNGGQFTRPMELVLLGVEQGALSSARGVEGDAAGAKPEE